MPDRCADGWPFCLIARHCRAVMDRPDGSKLFLLPGMQDRIFEEKGQNIDSHKVMLEFAAGSQRVKPDFGHFLRWLNSRRQGRLYFAIIGEGLMKVFFGAAIQGHKTVRKGRLFMPRLSMPSKTVAVRCSVNTPPVRIMMPLQNCWKKRWDPCRPGVWSARF